MLFSRSSLILNNLSFKITMTITQKIFAVFSLLFSMALMPQGAQARIDFKGYSDDALHAYLCNGVNKRCYSKLGYYGPVLIGKTPYCSVLGNVDVCTAENEYMTLYARNPNTKFMAAQLISIRADWEQKTGYIYKNARVPGEYQKIIGFDLEAEDCRLNEGDYFAKCPVLYEAKLFDSSTGTWSIKTTRGVYDFDGHYFGCNGYGGTDSTGNLGYGSGYNPDKLSQTYVPGYGCTNNNATIREEIPFNSSCEQCDPVKQISQVSNPTISTMSGNKISILNGDNTNFKNDINGAIPFTRVYNSRLIGTTTLGIGWRHMYSKKLEFRYNDLNLNEEKPKPVALEFIQENDKNIIFSRQNSIDPFTPVFSDQELYKVTFDLNTYTLHAPDGSKEIYSSSGQLLKIKYLNNRYLEFFYDNEGKLYKISDQNSRQLLFIYSDYADVILKVVSNWGDYVDYIYENGLLVTATLNSKSTITYTYKNGKLETVSNPSGVAHSQYIYDNQGRVIEKKNISPSTGAYNQTQITYNDNSTSILENGVTSTYYSAIRNYRKTLTNANLGGISNYQISYPNTTIIDVHGNDITATSDVVDAIIVDGNRTQLYYNNGRLSRTDTLGTNIAKNFTWNNDLGLLSGTTENSPNGSRNTTLEHDIEGNVIKKTINSSSGSRQWKYTYTTYGRMLTSVDPSGATTTYNYYADDDAHIGQRGQLKSITNALGQSLVINSYDNQGNPTTIKSSNGLTKTITYDNLGKVVSEIVGNMSKNYEYDINENIKKITLSNGYEVNYVIDELGRTRYIGDNNGNRKTIYYNSYGIESEGIYKNNQLVGGFRQTFDAIGRIKSKGHYPHGSTEQSSFQYDGGGNIGSSINAIGQNNSYSYDSARRLLSERTDVKNKSYTYDPDSNIASISINNQTTHYGYNDFAEIISINSPDTGITQFNHDAASRTTSKTDSDGTMHLYNKDALGRVVQIAHNSAMVESFIYDTNGIGQLAKITDASGNTTFNYNSFGAIVSKNQVVNGVSYEIKYGYDNLQQLTSMTYPSGAVVNYGYINGKVTSISVNNNPVISNITYYPFTNQPISWTWGSGGAFSKQYDSYGKLTKIIDTGFIDKTITMDGLYNIKKIQDTYNYVGSDITAYYNKNQQLGMVNINGFTSEYNHEDDMNRFESSYYTYTYNGNKINSARDNRTGREIDFEYDRRGNNLFNDKGEFAYDLKNNMIRASTENGYATYKFNALNQRVSKTVGMNNTYFMYDGSDMVGEYDGNIITEHIYIAGVPIAVLKNNQVYFVHTDEINTPRIITNGSNILWRWENRDAFGANLPISNNFEYNLRFAGQYFDNESKLHYNYYRTYDPRHGRYMQSDPIGLDGGDHTYNYVNSNPLSAIDPLGLLPNSAFAMVQRGANSTNQLMYDAASNDSMPKGWLSLYSHAFWGRRNPSKWGNGGIAFSRDSAFADQLDKNDPKVLALFNRMKNDTDGLISAQDFLDLLRAFKGLNNYQGIAIFGCNYGQSYTSSLFTTTNDPQFLSNSLGMDVMASDDYVVLNRDSYGRGYVEGYSAMSYGGHPIGFARSFNAINSMKIYRSK